MDWANSELRAFYEAESAARSRKRVHASSVRVRLLDEFADLLRLEGRRSVVDFGAGPGLDLKRFVDDDRTAVGIDLAVRNGQLAAEQSLTVVAASITDAPLRSNSFDAGWSMSTLMHLEPSAMNDAVTELARVLRAGAPAKIGLWGSSEHGTRIDDHTIAGYRRPFHHRSVDENASIIASAFGSIAEQQVLEIDGAFSDYQLFELRGPDRPGLPTSIKGVLRFKDEVVLLANERAEWELPGGQPESCESHAETVRREFAEELGLEVEVGDFIDTWTYEPVRGRHITIHTYEVTAADPGTLTHSHEHRAVGRFAVEQLGSLPLPAGYCRSVTRRRT